MENMTRCVQTYFTGSALAKQDKIEVLDIGGRDVSGSYADLFRDPKYSYKAVDVEPAKGVSIVLDDPHKLPLADNSVDLVISGQMLEQCEFFWQTFTEMMRVLKKDGFLFLIAPSSGPTRDKAIDGYRFYPDGFTALAKFAKCHVVEIWQDTRGPWNDLVGVFSKTAHKKQKATVDMAESAANSCLFKGPPWPPKEHEVTAGAAPYIETLQFIHRAFKPENYLEIGVRKGESLALASCFSVGVDPLPDVTHELGKKTTVIKQASDDFFIEASNEIFEENIDFSFIDGMHLFEYALRDFMNVERHSHLGTIVVIDDVFPNHPQQALRDRATVHWTGDVWKFYEVLKSYRPDLTLIPLDTHPTGLLMIVGLDPENTVLWDAYNPILEHYLPLHPPPQHIINRRGIIAPDSKAFKQAAQIIKQAREKGVPLHTKSEQIRKAITPDEISRQRKVEAVRGRKFKVSVPTPFLSQVQDGTLKTQYKGIRFCKNPFDIVLYLRLIEQLKPASIIEIGTSEGGSALWLRDQCRAFGLKTKIYSYDNKPPKDFEEQDIETGFVNAHKPEANLDVLFLKSLPKPWLVIEDSAHIYDTTFAVLKFFDPLLSSGDYIVVEDGTVADFQDKMYRNYKDGPNRAVHDFLLETKAKYEIDTELCDYYGHNVTYCPNAWLKVI